MYDFIYITDAVKAFCAIGDKGVVNRTYYIGSQQPSPLKEFIFEMRDQIDPKIEVGLGEIPYNDVSLTYNEFDIYAVEKDTDVVSKDTFAEGIRKKVARIREMT